MLSECKDQLLMLQGTLKVNIMGSREYHRMLLKMIHSQSEKIQNNEDIAKLYINIW